MFFFRDPAAAGHFRERKISVFFQLLLRNG